MLENPLLKCEPKDAEIICECACGCGRDIVAGYEAVYWEGEWFYERNCLLRFLGAEERDPGDES